MKVRWCVAGYLVAMAAVFVAPLSSDSPDVLEKVAEVNGFAVKAEQSSYSLIAGYRFPGVENEALGTLLAGWIGVTLVFVLVVGLTLTVNRLLAARS